MPQVGMQDPINALQNLAMQGTPGMGQQGWLTTWMILFNNIWMAEVWFISMQ